MWMQRLAWYLASDRAASSVGQPLGPEDRFPTPPKSRQVEVHMPLFMSWQVATDYLLYNGKEIGGRIIFLSK